jgi:rare lipoprotein A
VSTGVSLPASSRAWRRGSALTKALALTALLAISGCATHRRPAVLPADTVAPGWTQTGTASWYGPGYDGRRTSSGERFDQDGRTAAHATLPFGTRVRVTLLATGKSVIVRVNDRLPRRDRVIDLSRGAARAIGLIEAGTGRVRLVVVKS